MQDRPSAHELMAAVAEYLEGQAIPATEGAVQFQIRVCVHVLRILLREAELGEVALWREWSGLAELLRSDASRPPTLEALEGAVFELNESLAERIRSGEADSGNWADAVFEHVKEATRDKAAIADPKLIDADEGSPRRA
ncbi:MAG: hypothetical protein GEU28_08325 [Dehalococcoidia bacterium]|nr:hypothetical protein [Dehalococcoidia bacterium]